MVMVKLTAKPVMLNGSGRVACAHPLSGVGVSSCDGELTVSQQPEHKLVLGLWAHGLVARMCLSVTFSVLFGSIQLFKFDFQGYGGMSSSHLPFIH